MTLNPRDVCVIARQGRRPTMEDFHVLVESRGGILGAIFDGHNGEAVASIASAQLQPMYEDARPLEHNNAMGLVRALERIQDLVHDGTTGGACAVTFVLARDCIWVANLGDAEAMYVTATGVRPLTQQHNIKSDRELRRMVDAGALVRKPYFYDPLTGRGLMPTRSLGDTEFDGVGLLHVPDVQTVNLTEPGWIVAACDGLWDVIDISELPELLVGIDSADNAAGRLADEALEVRRTGDNLTVIVAKVG